MSAARCRCRTPKRCTRRRVELVLEHADFLSDGDKEYVLYGTAEKGVVLEG